VNIGIPGPRIVVQGEIGLDQLYPQPHLPSFIPGKLDAVVAQIDETLSQPETISHQNVGHACRPQARVVEVCISVKRYIERDLPRSESLHKVSKVTCRPQARVVEREVGAAGVDP
jgi:hypothetical protein